jgi:uncharacterized protein
MLTPPIRTITVGVAEPHPLHGGLVEEMAAVTRRVEAACHDAGYLVQTTRLSTRPIFDDLAGWTAPEIVGYGRDLQCVLERVGCGFCSLGPALAARPDFPLDRLDTIADLLVGAGALNCAVQLATTELGIRVGAAVPAAHIMRRLAKETDQGLGNFRFAVLACVDPGGPFFPASYHRGPASLSVGLQGAGIVAEALGDIDGLDLAAITGRVSQALITHAAPVAHLVERLSAESGLQFGGIDLSPAPAGEDSIAAAMERCGAGPVGGYGTLSLAAAITRGIRSTGLVTCGYNGLMLPVLEDATLARRWQERLVTIQQLLAYSAVCGTGLDTVPLPDDVSEDEIAHLLLDVATLAVRLEKPLSARFFPVPGKSVGERTTFASPYLVNTCV